MVALLLAPLRLPAQTPDDQYIVIYNLIQEADSLSTSAPPDQALAKYGEAQAALQKFQRRFPDWNPKVVTFRLNYLAAKTAALSAAAPALAATNKPPTAPAAAPGSKPPQLEKAEPGNLENQINSLKAQISQYREHGASVRNPAPRV